MSTAVGVIVIVAASSVLLPLLMDDAATLVAGRDVVSGPDRDGDLLVVVPGTIERHVPGDVVVSTREGELRVESTTHASRAPEDTVIGRVVLYVPALGAARSFLAHPVVLTFLLAGAITMARRPGRSRADRNDQRQTRTWRLRQLRRIATAGVVAGALATGATVAGFTSEITVTGHHISTGTWSDDEPSPATPEAVSPQAPAEPAPATVSPDHEIDVSDPDREELSGDGHVSLEPRRPQGAIPPPVVDDRISNADDAAPFDSPTEKASEPCPGEGGMTVCIKGSLG